MPYLCEPNGDVKRVSPSIIRRKLKKGWIRATDLAEYYIRRGTQIDEAQALAGALAFWRQQERRRQTCQEAQAHYNARLDEMDARRSAANWKAHLALARRIRQLEVDLLQKRGLPLDVPLSALSLPRNAKRLRLVAHGRGSTLVGAFHDPTSADH